LKRFLPFLLGGLFVGCAATMNVDMTGVTAQSVSEEIQSQSRSIHYFSTSGYGSFETKQGAYTARFEMSIHRPSSAVVSLYGPFGIKVAQVRLTDDTLIVYNSIRNEVFIGKPTAANLRNFLMIASDGTSFTDLLLDLMAPAGRTADTREARNLDGNTVSFIYTDQDTVETYMVDGEYMRTSGYEKSVDGETVLKIKYSDFKSVGNVFIPRSISFEDLQHGVSAKLYYQDTAVNQKESVEFSVPSDAKEIILN
jgi:outer membrane lipoprotein-sorting protein